MRGISNLTEKTAKKPFSSSRVEALRSKLSNERGDTIVEVLVALTIGALALTILAMAISVTSSLAGRSQKAMEDEYALETSMAMAQETAGCSGNASISLSDGTEVSLLGEGEHVDLSYCIPEGQSSGTPVVSYRTDGGE